MQRAYNESRGRSPNRQSPNKRSKDRDRQGSKKASNSHNKRSDERSSRTKFDNYAPLNMSRSRIWKEVAQTEMRNVERARPIKNKGSLDKNKYCAFHDQNGHRTDDCWDLRDAIEKNIRVGNLKQYLIRTQGKKNGKRRQRSQSRSPSPKKDDRKDRSQYHPNKGKKAEDNDEEYQEAEYECNVISGALGGGGDTVSARRRYLKKVMSVRDKPTFKGRAGKPDLPKLFFTEEDLQKVVPSHTDGLVITGMLVNYRVKRIFINPGSSADILFWNAFQKMNLV
ncbi:uncharacterized protein LOC133301678, partial [Gastrolobium bilobum]|uniref:uncharacterized protein LOC133301678 n=1 Tax=Gastrolobium bilobum TaxID=150636 RepID=UPI002AB12276